MAEWRRDRQIRQWQSAPPHNYISRTKKRPFLHDPRACTSHNSCFEYPLWVWLGPLQKLIQIQTVRRYETTSGCVEIRVSLRRAWFIPACALCCCYRLVVLVKTSSLRFSCRWRVVLHAFTYSAPQNSPDVMRIIPKDMVISSAFHGQQEKGLSQRERGKLSVSSKMLRFGIVGHGRRVGRTIVDFSSSSVD